MFPQSDIITATVAPAKLLYRVIHVFPKLSVNTAFKIRGSISPASFERTIERAFSIFALEKSIQNRLSDRTSMGRDWDSVPLSPSYAVHPTRPQIFSDPSACIRVVAAHFHRTFSLEGWRHVTSELTAAKQRYKGRLFLSPVNEGAAFFFCGEKEREGGKEGERDGWSHPEIKWLFCANCDKCRGQMAVGFVSVV